MLRLSLNSCFRQQPIATSYTRAPVALSSIRHYTTTPVTSSAGKQEETISNTITENDLIHRVNLRVGQIVKVDQHPDADHLFIEQGIYKYNPFFFSFYMRVNIFLQSPSNCHFKSDNTNADCFLFCL